MRGEAVARGRDYLGAYRRLRIIRAGATCQVWEAIHDGDSRRVAIKLPQPEHISNKEEIEFLRHEFEVAQNFKHTNVIEVYEFNIDKGTPYLVMELSTAKNLKIVMRQGLEPMIPLIPKIIEQAAAGLQYMHEQNWVHRDIKPDNFLVSDEGDVKLIDFAIAQRPATGLAKGLAMLFGKRGAVQGTRSYMSPEQIRNDPLDCRADIYSFGCLLFELVTGKLPYTGLNADDLLAKHLRAPVPQPLVANNQLTNEFAGLLTRMMAKNRDDRPKSMEDFLKMFRTMRVFKVKLKS
ncbi:MAG TPA: serine/threonine-protein kinase [Pirellulaceae bacterium]|nr:serine/threonine-protein kinase [Pirellulaceae bacterium]